MHELFGQIFLYGHRIQFLLLFVLSIALSVAFAPTAYCSWAYALFYSIALTIVHLDGTYILSFYISDLIKIPLQNLILMHFLTNPIWESEYVDGIPSIYGARALPIR